ncbi:MAG: glycosyltransferase, partial [Thermoleophilia bacterium]
MSPEDLKRQFPFDQYGRYATIRDIINTNRQEGQRFRVLDVGGRGNILRQFLPADDVFYLDPNLDEEDANFIAGDGGNIPGEDGGFDFVVSADVFEHIPAVDRKQFIAENLRAAKLAVILAAPFYSPETELAERLANESYKVISRGEDHAWLQEHIANGLPHEREVEDELQAGGYAFQKIANNDLKLWQSLIYANFVIHELGEKAYQFNEFYNEQIFPLDHGELSYRKIYFIKKDAGLQDLQLAPGKIDTGLYLEAIRSNYSLLSEVYLQDKDQIAALTQADRQKDLLVAQKAAQLARKQTELEHKYMEVSQRTAELDRVYASKSWQATRPFRVLWRSVAVMRRDGPATFWQKAVAILVGRYQPRLAARSGFYSELHLQIKQWYRNNRKKVTIVIPSYNDHQLLAKCLASIRKTTDDAWVNVVVVDDASTDQAHLDFLRSIDRPNVEVIFQEQNGGFARTVNAGLMSVPQGDVIVLNSDIVAQKLWLQSLQFAAYQDDRVGIVGPKLLYPDGTIQYAGSHRNTGSPDWFDHYYRFQQTGFPPANIPNYVIGITGACMYIKRDVIRDVGYLDEKFPMAFEDMDYSLRAWNGGYRSYYFPAATLTHHESATRTKNQGDRELESLRYFWEKWGDWFDGRNVYDADGNLRVIYVLQATGIGGGHRLVFEQLNRLQEIGVAVELYALEEQPEWFPLQVQVRTFEDYEQLIAALEQEEAIKVATWWETAQPVWLASVNKGIPVYYVQDIEASYYPDDEQMQATVLSRYRKE